MKIYKIYILQANSNGTTESRIFSVNWKYWKKYALQLKEEQWPYRLIKKRECDNIPTLNKACDNKHFINLSITKLWKKSYTAEELKQVNPVNLLSALSILDPSFKMIENNLDGSNPNVIPDFQIRGTASMESFFQT